MIRSWTKVKLSEVLSQYKDYIDQPEPRLYPKLSVRLYGKGVLLDAPADGATLRMKRHQIVRAGQVILSEIWGKKGAIGFVPAEGDGALCTSHFFLFDVQSDQLEPRYLDLIFRANYLEHQLGGEAKGTTGYAAVRPKHLLNCEIPLPPLAEQRRIVARIEGLAAKIEEAHALRNQTSDEAEVLCQHSAEEIFEKVAESNPLYPLGELVTIRGGGTPSKANPFYWDGNLPWITPKDMKARELQDGSDHISMQATHETAAKLIAPGAVLVVVRGMILAHTFPAAVLRAPAAINQDMKALVPKGGVLPEFICAMFWAYNRRILDLVEKSTHDTRKLETQRLLDTKIAVPSLSEQRRIVAELDTLQLQMDALKKAQAETAAELDALLPSIMDRAFKGEL